MNKSIKKKIFEGGISLIVKQIISAFLSFLSILVIARILGPEEYGIVSITLGIFYFMKYIGRMGLGVYIVRQKNLFENEVEQILCFFNTVGVLVCCILWLSAPLFSIWTQKTEVLLALRLIIPAIWFDMVGSTALSMLERDLNFRTVGFINSLAEISNYIFSLGLLLIHKSYLVVISGYVLQFFLIAVLSHFCHPIRWCLRWEWKTLRSALHYGFSYSCANWILNLKSLTIPLFLSRLAGVEAVAIANVSLRITQKLLLFKDVIRNMSVSVMAKLLNNNDLIKKALTKGMLYQALIMGLICSVFSGFASLIIPFIFGEEWLLSAHLFPFISFSMILGSVFNLHSALLYASGFNRLVGYFHLCYVGILWLSSIFFIPKFGVIGYGIAEVIALPSYYVIHMFLKENFTPPDYGPVMWTILATIPPLFLGVYLHPFYNLFLIFIFYTCLFALSKNTRIIVLKALK